jgi:transposase
MQRAQKRGADGEAIGRSRGGPSTKINAVVDALANPLRFILTGGQVHDSKQAGGLSAPDCKRSLYDKHIYVERFFCAIKQFHRIATRYDKTATLFAGMLCLAGALVSLR